MSDFKAKMHQIRFRLRLRPRPHWGSLQRSPDPLAGFKGPTSKGREGRGRKRGQEGEGRDQEKGKGEEERGRRGGEGDRDGRENLGGPGPSNVFFSRTAPDPTYNEVQPDTVRRQLYISLLND